MTASCYLPGIIALTCQQFSGIIIIIIIDDEEATVRFLDGSACRE
ncbi:hypothetical protein [Microbacterium enclense]